MEKKINKFLEGKIWQSAVIDTDKISFTEDVVAACKVNHCGKYKTNWMCPPAVGELSVLKAKYQKYKKAYIYTTKWEIEDSFDIEGMLSAGEKHTKLTDSLRDELLITKSDFKILGGGACRNCIKCTYPDKPCRFPDKAYPSVEACGIDVVNLAKISDILYNNGINTVTYFSVIFYN